MGIYGHKFDSLLETQILKESSSIYNENKKIITDILNKIFNISVKKMNDIKKKYNAPYIAESSKPTLPKESECYELDDENNDDYFGYITLLKIDSNKAFKYYDPNKVTEIDINKWEDIISELVKDINSDKTISSYGKAFVEQPDDGGQIMFKIKKSLLKFETTSVSSSKEYNPHESLDKYIKNNDINRLRENLGYLYHFADEISNKEIREDINYVASKTNKLFEKFDPSHPLILDNKKLKDITDDDLEEAVYWLMKNFCKERIKEVEKIRKQLHYEWCITQ